MIPACTERFFIELRMCPQDIQGSFTHLPQLAFHPAPDGNDETPFRLTQQGGTQKVREPATQQRFVGLAFGQAHRSRQTQCQIQQRSIEHGDTNLKAMRHARAIADRQQGIAQIETRLKQTYAVHGIPLPDRQIR